jgi:hypothetical protein
VLKWIALAAVGVAGFVFYRRWSEKESGYAATARDWADEARDRLASAAAAAGDAGSDVADRATRARDTLGA